MTHTPNHGGRILAFPTRFSSTDRRTLDEGFGVRRTGIRFFPMLHGFMTAIAIGPTSMPQETWLRAVWGHRVQPQPLEQRRIARLRDPVLRLYSSVERSLRPESDSFRIDFSEGFGPRDTTLCAEIWCDGFFKGALLDDENWRWLAKTSPELIRPIWLFGRHAGLKAMVHTTGGYGDTARRWLPRIEPAVRTIRDYWLTRPDQGAKPRRRKAAR